MADIAVTVVADGHADWETKFDEGSVPFLVAWQIREHYAWDADLPDIALVVGDRVFELGTLAIVAAFSPKQHDIRVRASVRGRP